MNYHVDTEITNTAIEQILKCCENVKKAQKNKDEELIGFYERSKKDSLNSIIKYAEIIKAIRDN